MIIVGPRKTCASSCLNTGFQFLVQASRFRDRRLWGQSASLNVLGYSKLMNGRLTAALLRTCTRGMMYEVSPREQRRDGRPRLRGLLGIVVRWADRSKTGVASEAVPCIHSPSLPSRLLL